MVSIEPRRLPVAQTLLGEVAIMALSPICEQTHLEIVRGVCPYCQHTISKGRILWEIPARDERAPGGQIEARPPRIPFPLFVKDENSRLPALISNLSERREGLWDDSTFQLFAFGWELDLWELEEIERSVGPDRRDLWLRIVLLGAYLHMERTLETVVGLVQRHVLWIIENTPGAFIAGMLGTCRLNRFEEDVGFRQRARELWIAALAANPRDLAILSNGAEFLERLDPVLSGQILRAARTLEPVNFEWSRRLATLYGRETRKRTDESRLDWAAMTLAAWQEAESLCGSELERLTVLPNLALSAIEAGALERARAYAHDALAQNPASPLGRRAVHIGRLVLGRIALEQGDVEAAKRGLIESLPATESSAHGGSAVFDDFLPHMSLANALLKRGERECVLRYLRLCARFRLSEIRLAPSTEEVERGESPELPEWLV